MKKFINNISIKNRLYLSLSLILIPVLFLLGNRIFLSTQEIKILNNEIQGIEASASLWNLLEVSTKIQAFSVLNQKSSNEDQIELKSVEKEFFTSISKFKKQGISISHTNLEGEIQSLYDFQKGTRPYDFSFFWGLKLGLLNIFQDVADKSNLILDSRLDSYYLMQLSIIDMPYLLHQCSTSFALANLGNETLTLQELERCQTQLKQVHKTIQRESDYNPHWKKYTDENYRLLEKKFNHFQDNLQIYIIQKSSATGNKLELLSSQNTKSYVDFTSELSQFQKASLEELKRILYDRLSGEKKELIGILFLSLFLILFAFIFQAYVIRTIHIPIKSAVKKFEQLQFGNLSQGFGYPYKDEFGSLYSSMDEFLIQVRRIVIELKTYSDKVTRYAENSAHMAKILSDSSQSQAGQLESSSSALNDVASSFEQISSLITREKSDIDEMGKITQKFSDSITSINDQMRGLQKLAEYLMNQAQKGEIQAYSTTQSMKFMKEVTHQIGGIVSMITEISDQTNLLSLNASIEAARAGESGKGFAVVAQEVSKLSDRSVNSVSDIKKLIKSSDTTVDDAVKLVDESVKSLHDIVENISDIHVYSSSVSKSIKNQETDLVSLSETFKALQFLSEEVTESALEEQKSLSRISGNIEQISSSTQTIAGNAEALSELSKKLDDAANNLRESIQWFRI